MLIDDFNHTLDIWIHDLDSKTFAQLLAKPSPSSWSLGQVYVHLIENTNYFLEQVSICLATDDCSKEEMSPSAKGMFRDNEFPDELIEGPPENDITTQPESKEKLLSGFLELREKVNRLQNLISISSNNGKTKHTGLLYFNATEWFQFAEMHLRHHLRQKKRIDEFLNANENLS